MSEMSTAMAQLYLAQTIHKQHGHMQDRRQLTQLRPATGCNQQHRLHFNPIKTAEQRAIIQQYSDWYTGR